MARPTHVAIPFRGKVEMTNALVRQITLEGYADHIIMMNNGNVQGRYPWTNDEWNESNYSTKTTVETIEAKDWNLHRMFNFAIERAMSIEILKHGPVKVEKAGKSALIDEIDRPCVNVGLFNNDLVLEVPDYVERLGTALRADPTLALVGGTPHTYDPNTVGDILWANHETGHRGEAVMLRGELPFRFDERFELWRGDDDLVAQIQNAGYWVGIVTEARHTHIGGGGGTSLERYGQQGLNDIIERDTLRFHRKWSQIPMGKLCLERKYLFPIGTAACMNPTEMYE